LKYREDKGEPIKTAIEQMTGIKLKMLEIKGTLDECRGSIMGYEGSAGRIYFDKIKNGVTLNKEGKQFYIAEINKMFDDSIRYRGRNIKIKDTIQFECHRIAQELLKSERIQTADYADSAD